MPYPTFEKQIRDLLDKAEMCRVFFDLAPIGCVLADMNGKLLYVNDAYAKILERTTVELIGHSYGEFTPKIYQETGDDTQQMNDMLNGLLVGPFEKSYHSPDRTQLIKRCDLRLIRSADDGQDVPAAGNNLAIVADVDDVLHFRVFDGDGTKVIDTDEHRLTEQATVKLTAKTTREPKIITEQIHELRTQLESLWPPHALAENEKNQIMDDLADIVGRTLIKVMVTLYKVELNGQPIIWSIVVKPSDQRIETIRDPLDRDLWWKSIVEPE